MSGSLKYYALGLVFLGASFTFPENWFLALPVAESAKDFPVSGIMLLKLSFFLNAVVLFVLGLRDRSNPFYERKGLRQLGHTTEQGKRFRMFVKTITPEN